MEENKRRVNKALKEKKVDLAVNTNWPFIGTFLKFLERTGIMKELGTITGKQIRKMLSPQIFTLLYILKTIVGIPTISGSEALLGDMGAMKMLGFDIDQLMNGLCKRGDANQHGKGYKKNAYCNGPVYIIRQY
ncbi:MAG: hypothetical protein NC902_08470 [Candidatus Omnitrophica bacterium]|nr:hypothetical protein [Candidatus Omnitrophota bacterium]